MRAGLLGFDGIVVINLDRRPERWVAFQEDWRDILPWDRVVRLPATDGQTIPGYGRPPWFRAGKRDQTWAARAGCVLSHARAMREAQGRNWVNVLVLEDDAVPTQADFVCPPQQAWDLLYLGCGKPQTLAGPHLWTSMVPIAGALETHAHAVNARLRDWLATQLPDEDEV